MNAIVPLARLDDLFPEVFRRLARPMLLAGDAPQDIRLDLIEHEKEYVVEADIPGARKEDIRVAVDGNFVSISAEVQKDREEKVGSRVLLKETCFGSVSRGFSLPQEIDAAKVQAKLKDGVLRLTLPKSEASSSRLVAID